jgi:hypothetical protein
MAARRRPGYIEKGCRPADRAGVLAGDYWDLFDDDQRQQFGEWLETVHADFLRPVFGPRMNDKLRVIEVELGAADALKRKASP